MVSVIPLIRTILLAVERISSRRRHVRIYSLYFTAQDLSIITCSWEPIDSFNGSENIVSTFWQRANVGGRNVEDLSQFNLGETFRPVGPPSTSLSFHSQMILLIARQTFRKEINTEVYKY